MLRSLLALSLLTISALGAVGCDPWYVTAICVKRTPAQPPRYDDDAVLRVVLNAVDSFAQARGFEHNPGPPQALRSYIKRIPPDGKSIAIVVMPPKRVTYVKVGVAQFVSTTESPELRAVRQDLAEALRRQLGDGDFVNVANNNCKCPD